MMNRRVTLVVVLVMIVLATGVWGQANPQAEERDRLDLAGLARGPAIVGGGLFFGEPSGFTGKLWFPETGFAVDTLLAWSLEDTGRLYVHADGIYHLALIETDGGRYISPSVGLGILGRVGSNSSLGVRLPVGLSLFLFPSFPLELFGEISPGIGLFPDTGEEFGVGLGVRLYLPAGSS